MEAYERAAHAQERLGSSWHAAKHYEVIADLVRKDGRPPADAARYWKLAADAYIECGKPPTGVSGCATVRGWLRVIYYCRAACAGFLKEFG